MLVVYTGEKLISKQPARSLFLCGGSLRPGQEVDMVSWRKEAVRLLEAKGFNGVVFSPEPRDAFSPGFDYDNQIAWEDEYLNAADVILFWMPRDLSLDSRGHLKMACLVSNVEFGVHMRSGRVVLGSPPNAQKMGYLKHYATKLGIPMSDTLEGTIDNALKLLADKQPKQEPKSLPFWARLFERRTK